MPTANTPGTPKTPTTPTTPGTPTTPHSAATLAAVAPLTSFLANGTAGPAFGGGGSAQSGTPTAQPRDLSGAVKLIRSFEGIEDGDPTTANLDPYLCPAGYWTIGWGHVVIGQDGQMLR